MGDVWGQVGQNLLNIGSNLGRLGAGLYQREMDRVVKQETDNFAVYLRENDLSWRDQNVRQINAEDDNRDNPTEYYKALPDKYEQYLRDKYTEFEAKLTTQRSRDAAESMFGNYLVSQKDALAEAAYKKKVELQAVELENNYHNAVAMGDRGLLNQVLSGPTVVDPATIQAWREAGVYQIGFQEYQRTLLSLPADTALKFIDERKQLRYFNLDGEEKVLSPNDTAALRDAVVKQQEAEGVKVYTDLQNRISEGNWKDITRPELIAARDNVDPAHRNDVTALLEDFDKVHNLTPEQMVESVQRRSVLTMSTALSRWVSGGKVGPAPFTEEQIIEAAAPPPGTAATLAEGDAKSLLADLAAANESTAEDPQDIRAAGLLGKMTGAVAQATPTDPWVAVPDGALEMALRDKQISVDGYNSLVGERLRLGRMFRDGSTVGQSTAEGKAAAYGIAYNPLLEPTQKYAQIDALVNKGLSTNDAATARGWVDIYNGNDQTEEVFSDLEAYYRERIGNEEDPAKQRAAAYERVQALDYMQDFMRRNPGDIDAAKKARDDYLGGQATANMGRRAIDLLGETTVVTAQGRVEGRGNYVSAARQALLRERGQLLPAELTQFKQSGGLDRERQLEQDALKQFGMTPVVTEAHPGDPNTLVYYTDRPARDAAGRPVLTAAAHIVQYAQVGDEQYMVIRRYNPETKRFDRTVWSGSK